MEKQKQTQKKKASSIDILKPIKMLSKRFHLTLFFVLIVGCLSGAVLMINKAIQENPTDPTFPSVSTDSDQVTLTRLKRLHNSSQSTPTPVSLPGRTNPFGE